VKVKDIVTIDGPSGSGKSTISKILAERLGYTYLDTGALYRAVAWKVRDKNIDPDDEEALDKLLKDIEITFKGEETLVNGIDVTTLIRDPDISDLSSRVSEKSIVRRHLFEMQRTIGLNGKVVVEGRDIGSAVLPEAGNKFYLDASIQERGRRRYEEIKDIRGKAGLNATIEALKKRDKRDSARQDSPLKRTEDMIYIDTSNLTINEVVSRIMAALRPVD
jgi:cytidylate kinase